MSGGMRPACISCHTVSIPKLCHGGRREFGCWDDQGALPGEDTQASSQKRVRNMRTGLVVPQEQQCWVAAHVCICTCLHAWVSSMLHV